jgi:hypothetical protein
MSYIGNNPPIEVGELADNSVLISKITATGTPSSSTFLRGDSTWSAAGASEEIFYYNNKNVISNYTITANKNAMSAGEITIDSGVTVTVSSGSNWVIV